MTESEKKFNLQLIVTGSHLSEKLSDMGHEVIGIDNMIGGYDDNVPKNIKFYNLDCCDFKKINELMKGIEVVYHCAATAHEGLSVFSPFEITICHKKRRTRRPIYAQPRLRFYTITSCTRPSTPYPL